MALPMDGQNHASKHAPHFRLDGKVALVTGSSKGLGKAMAFALGAAGAKVAFNYANGKEWAEETFAEYKAAGYAGGLYRASVIDPAEVKVLCAQITAELGPIDILIPNATPAQPLKPIEQYDWAFYQSMLDFFVKSPYLLTLEVLPHMKKQKWGRIINITSEVFNRGVAPFSAYVAANDVARRVQFGTALVHSTYGITASQWICWARARDTGKAKSYQLNLQGVRRRHAPDAEPIESLNCVRKSAAFAYAVQNGDEVPLCLP